MKHKRSTEAIVALAKKKSEETAQLVEQAIKQLIKKNERINFNSVSIESGVSKSYLYNHSEFRERIDMLRKQQQQVKSPKAVKRQMSDESKDAMIQLLRDRIKELENENKRLKDENKRLQGKLMSKFNKERGMKAMSKKLILLEGIPGSGKSTFARFIAVQLERNGYKTKLYHETTGDHPLFFDNNDHDLDIGSWMNEYLENWQRMIDQLKETDDSVVLESALFQYPILNLLHKDLERRKITDFIEQICSIAHQIQPVLFYFYQEDPDMAIRKMIDSRGGERFLKQKYEQFMNEPYYKNRGNTGASLHLAFLSEYGQLANIAFRLNKFNKLSVENSKGEWESYQKQLLQFLQLSFYDDPMIDPNILEDYAGIYRNEIMNINLIVEHVDGQLFIFGNRMLQPKNLYQFYLSDISVEVTFNRDENGLVNNLVVGEKDIHVNMKDEGTQFIKIS